jgi:hypothetical protein
MTSKRRVEIGWELEMVPCGREVQLGLVNARRGWICKDARCSLAAYVGVLKSLTASMMVVRV